jgi:hypothetical protein
MVLIVNVAISILYMVVYGYVIDPGHEQAYYEAHIQQAAPYSSIVAGIPLMFFAGWWVSRWWDGQHGIRSAFFVWLAYAVIDLAIVLTSGGLTSHMALLVAASLITKLLAAIAGAAFGSRK